MRIMKVFLIWTVSGLIGVLIGCGGSTVGTYREGRLYVVNNAGWGSNLGEVNKYIVVKWEGEMMEIPLNMNQDGSPTGVGAVQLTPDPLPGGTPIDFTYYFYYVGDRKPMQLSEVLKILGEEATIDGDITIEIYSATWNPGSNWVIAYARVVKGKFDGSHPYPELTGGS